MHRSEQVAGDSEAVDVFFELKIWGYVKYFLIL